MAHYPLELLLVDVRSAHNVGAILRSADGFRVAKVICAGLTPYPRLPGDDRLPHIAASASRKIAKTALGAEATVKLTHQDDPLAVIAASRSAGYRILALEQAVGSLPLRAYRPSGPMLLILGAEVGGLSPIILKQVERVLEIPMQGKKESLNVAVAAGIALYQLSQA